MVNKKKTCGKSDGMSSASLPLFSVDDCFCRVPAAGWRNGTSLNNVGENRQLLEFNAQRERYSERVQP